MGTIVWNEKKKLKIGNLNDLQAKRMNALYLYSCNAGRLDQYYYGTAQDRGVGNVASVMSKKVLNGVVYAYDGNVGFGYSFPTDKILGSRGPLEARLSTIQEIFNNTADYYGKKRKPKGCLTYYNGKYMPYGYSPNTTISSAK